MTAPESRPREDVLLHDVYRELVREQDYDVAEGVVDMLTSVVAVEELIVAIDHGDRQAMAFHASLVLQSLDSAR